MLLVSNDFPPKVGGIQNYLYELVKRLPFDDTRVITTKYNGALEFDREQSFEIERYSKILWPTPLLARHVNKAIDELGPEVVFIDPALPTGLIAPRLRDITKCLIVHGAEITTPGKIPPTRALLKKEMKSIDVVLSAGTYAAQEMANAIGSDVNYIRIPPGVDIKRFSFPNDSEKKEAKEDLRKKIGANKDTKIIVSISRLVPRKGFDVLISALSKIKDDVHIVIVGKGRDEKRLKELANKKGVARRVHFLGSVSDSDLRMALHGSDIFAMLCRDRWKSLEAEGFGIVFLEAQSCGLPVIVGDSGGSSESMIEGKTGYCIDPKSEKELIGKVRALIQNQDLINNLGAAGREFVEKFHSYDYLAAQLVPVVQGDFSDMKTVSPK